MDHETQALLEYPKFVGRLYKRVGRHQDPANIRKLLRAELDVLDLTLPVGRRIDHLGNLVFLLQALCNEYDVSIISLLDENRRRLTRRYPTGFVAGGEQVNLDPRSVK